MTACERNKNINIQKKSNKKFFHIFFIGYLHLQVFMLICIHNNKNYCIGIKFGVGSNPLHKNPMITFLYTNNSWERPTART